MLHTRQRCALTAKGIRYWEFVPEVLGFSADVDHVPCPFVGGWYQWMRNMVGARAMERRDGMPHTFLVVYADGPFPMARKIQSDEWRRFLAHSTGLVQGRTVSFQRLVALAIEAVSGPDVTTIEALAAWIDDKVRRAAP